MKCAYPDFEARRRKNGYVFRGELQPTDDSPCYAVVICYERGSIPKVFVADPEIDDEAPHLYDDGSLCLFNPRIFRWDDSCLVSRHIVPWAALWLYFYETWLELGVWLGPEAPHFREDGSKEY